MEGRGEKEGRRGEERRKGGGEGRGEQEGGGEEQRECSRRGGGSLLGPELPCMTSPREGPRGWLR